MMHAMAPFRFSVPLSDVQPVEDPWLLLWRALWFDLPLAWCDEADRFLHRRFDPVTTQAGSDGASRSEAASSREDMRPEDRPASSAQAVALGLGCGDYSAEALPELTASVRPHRSGRRRSRDEPVDAHPARMKDRDHEAL